MDEKNKELDESLLLDVKMGNSEILTVTKFRNSVKKSLCLNFREFTLLLAIIAFISTALLTFSMVLGLKHMRDAHDLVLNDLNEEECEVDHAISFEEHQQIKANKKLLHDSQNNVQVMIFLLDIGTIFGCLNQITCGLMLYGISARSPNCILPWLIISGITHLMIAMTVSMSYLNLIPEITFITNHLGITLTIATFFMIIWYAVLMYYFNLYRLNRQTKKGDLLSPNIMEAYGGYIHRIDDVPIEKKIIV